MRKIFSAYYKYILSVAIVITVASLKENAIAFNEWTNVKLIVRSLLYLAWGCILATRIRSEKVKKADAVIMCLVGELCYACFILFSGLKDNCISLLLQYPDCTVLSFFWRGS